MHMPNQAELREIVVKAIVDVLAVEEQEVMPDARFFADLGGESIDLLDLSFHLEKRLGSKVDFSRLLTGGALGADVRGPVSAQALQALAANYPFLPTDRLPPNPTQEDLKDLLTVDVLTHFAALAQAAAPTAPAGAQGAT
jgi:acyl carrier protein